MSKPSRVAPLSADDVQRLVRRASGRGHTGSRNRALVAAFAGAGIGVAEALALTASDLDASAATLHVAGPRPRELSLDGETRDALVAWVAERDGLGLDSAGPLFCTREGLPLEASYIRRLLARLGREAEIGGVVNARGLRESYAARRLAAGATVEELSRELGHATIASTQRFVRQIDVPEADATTHLPPEIAEAIMALAHSGLTVVRAERDARGLVRDFVYEYINATGAALAGRPPEEMLGARVSAVFPNSPSDGTFARWIELIETQGRAGYPRVVEAEGRTRVFRVRRLAVGDRIVMSFDDQSAARQAERMLAALETRHGALLECLPTGVLVLNASGEVVSANPAAHRILGVPQGRLVGRTPWDPRWRPIDEHGERLDPAEQPAIRTRTTGQAVRDRRMGVQRPDGHVAWISVDTEAIEGPSGAPYGVVLSLTDLGRARRAEARARGAEAAIGLLHSATPTLLLRCRPDGTILSAVGPVEDLVGCAPSELEGGNCADAVDPPDRPAVREAYRAAMESAGTVEISHGVRDRTGELLQVTRTLQAVRDPASGDVEEVQSLLRWRP